MPKDIGGFRRLPGTERNYVEISSGVIVSRYYRDQQVGALKESGFASYGDRQRSQEIVEQYTNKVGEPGTRFDLHGITDANKAIEYLVKNIPAKDTSFYSLRIKLADGSWRSTKTGDNTSISTHFNTFMSKYELEPSDVEDIELVILG